MLPCMQPFVDVFHRGHPSDAVLMSIAITQSLLSLFPSGGAIVHSACVLLPGVTFFSGSPTTERPQ